MKYFGFSSKKVLEKSICSHKTLFQLNSIFHCKIVLWEFWGSFSYDKKDAGITDAADLNLSPI